MMTKNKLSCTCAVVFLICACNNKIKKYYPNGGPVKTEITYRNKFGNRIEKDYYLNGVISEQRSYINDTLNGDFFLYHSTGEIKSKGFFKDGVAVGGVYFYYKGRLVLYNERDFNETIFYVQKFDSISFSLIKEQGFCLSSNIVRKRNVDSTCEIQFFYAEPDGYKNELTAFVNNKPVAVQLYKGHIAKVLMNNCVKKQINIYSLLKDKNGVKLRDSLNIFW